MSSPTFLTSICVALLALPGVAGAQQASSQTQGDPTLVQVFACSLKSDSTMEEVWRLAESWRDSVEQMPNVSDDPEFGAFLWTPFRTAAPYDFIWGVISSDLRTLGKQNATYYGSEAGQRLDQEFLSLVDCASGIVFSEQIQEGRLGTSADRQPDALVETFTCRLNEGKTQRDLADLIGAWRELTPGIQSDAFDAYQAFLWTPYRGGSGDWDFAWVGTYPDFVTWGEGEADYHASQPGQQLEDAFGAASRCGSGLWTGYWILVPDVVAQTEAEP